ncbi:MULTISPECIES: AAA family ATPase [unclassified Fusibacter]|uniref:AAA family ATPase n=1 Tax=unclassified Fusibacter TaxID=2624464 RepID=UPI001013BE1D|nr:MULTISPECIES: AAA family ATPase [unclassified Fusibacter]MCK8058204.1 AAA family ATPase [Fusibacter sp. A2]NPE20787.1 AAA domain-containing protein [Fusibacter sp. A1]RXV62993.1 topology modulation protein [Fusibacter sp. A1]
MKIIIIGSPGSGKSTLSKKLSEALNLPLLHLDRIYHIDNHRQITREALMNQVYDFDHKNESWIIDGNFISTAEKRIELSDTIIYMKLPTDICLENIHKRAIEYKDKPRSDMAPGFKDGPMDDEFVSFVKNFSKDTSPLIDELLIKYGDKRIIIVEEMGKADQVIEELMKIKERDEC